jgi:serine/threonine-protein kinase
MNLDPTDLVGQSLGPFKLERLIGQGGFAWVFVGREDGGMPVAVKVLKPRYAGDPVFESGFRNESETAARLEHPQVIRIRSVGKAGRQVYFAMDLCADSLAQRIAREGPLPEADVLRIGRDVCRGLAYAHAQGVIHRDLTPDNILLRSDGGAVISDFGIARTVSGYVASTGVDMTVGTPHYMSPEQAQGRPVDQRADFYALGVMLYKAMTGVVPFASADWFELARMHVEDPPASPRKKRPDLSKRLERVIYKCLAKHPDDRYPNADALLADLIEVEARRRPTADLGHTPVGSAALRALEAPPRRRWLAVVGVLVGLIALVALVVSLMR